MASLTPRRGRPHLRLISCGHHDPQKSGFIWSEAIWNRLIPLLAKLPALTRSVFFPVTLTMICQPLLAMAAIAGANRKLVTVGGGFILAVYNVIGVLLVDWAIARQVPGASDNASGAAAVLTLGEEWLREPIDGVEVVPSPPVARRPA